MKKVLAFGIAMLMAGSAYAVTPKNKVDCDVNGVKKKVKSEEACKTLGGTVIPKKPAAKPAAS